MGIEVKTRNAQLVEIECYECPACSSLHDDEYDAQRCCDPERTNGWQCEVCDEIHSNKNVKCCVEEYKICTQCGCETHLDRCCEELF